MEFWLLLAAFLQEDRLGEGWAKAETEHYFIHGESGKKIVDEYRVNIELLFREYAKAFQFKGKLEKKAKVFIHKSRESYVRAGAPGSSVAYYDSEAKRLVSYEDRELLQFMAHEATHQFFDLAFPSFYSNPDLPMWFSEGIAECFCNCEIRGGAIYINVLVNCENAWRNVEACKDALQTKEIIAIREMLQMSEETFGKRSDLMYPLSWSFCHFLWNYPGTSEGKGKYREAIIRLVEAFKEGKKRDEAYTYGFVVAKKELNLDQLDAEWRQYLKGLKAKRPPQPNDK